MATSFSLPIRFISSKKPQTASEQYCTWRLCGLSWLTCVSNRLFWSRT